MTNSKGWLISILVVLALGLGWASLDFKPDAATAAPLEQAAATRTPLINDAPGIVNLDAAIVVGVKATPGAAGTPAIYEPISSTGGALNTSGGAGSSGYAVGTVVPIQPNGAVANQTPLAVQQVATPIVQVVGTVTVQDANLPAAATAADAVANPSLTKIGGFLSIFNGTTWDRWRTASSADGTGSLTGIPGVGLMMFDSTGGAVHHMARTAASDGQAVRDPLSSGTMRFNGTTWDRERGNIDTAALITAAGATTTQTTADQTNYNGRCVTAVLDMTTVGTGSVTATIQGKDAASGKYYTLLAGAAVTTNSTNVYTVCPGAPTTANVSASLPLPRVWRIVATANNANAASYTVGASVTN